VQRIGLGEVRLYKPLLPKIFDAAKAHIGICLIEVLENPTAIGLFFVQNKIHHIFPIKVAATHSSETTFVFAGFVGSNNFANVSAYIKQSDFVGLF
jgi:hypothetical protein